MLNRRSLYLRIYSTFKTLTNFPVRMKVFTQVFDPLNGKNEWMLQNDKYDYYQEISRSAYADMLHDKERNHLYYVAIKKAITDMKNQNRIPKVLDIGTGSGLLSMMAMKSGAHSVIACEAFTPVAECALQVIKDNGFEEKIKVIPKRSTEVTVGDDGDMPERANILVTEVFDTELIGEGALGTFKHALDELLEPNSIVVPSSAIVYAQVVDAPGIVKFNRVQEIVLDERMSIVPPEQVQNCPGVSAVHDIQMMQLHPTEFSNPSKSSIRLPTSFTPLTSAIDVFKFDFTGKIPLKFNDISFREDKVIDEGTANVVFMWWELKMDAAGSVLLSCAPPWFHPTPDNMQWRDHWMQAVYYLPKDVKVSKGETLYLSSQHDEYSLWFTASKFKETCTKEIPHPVCDCTMHCVCSRTRLGMLNDTERNMKYIQILKKHITPSTVCLCLGDGSLLPLMCAKLGAKAVFAVERDQMFQKLLKSRMNCNTMTSVIKVIEKAYENVTLDDLGGEKVDLLVAEPFFTTGLLPWDTLYFYFLRISVLAQLLKCTATVMPQKIIIKAVALQFEDLHQIRAPVVATEGFNLTSFDAVVQSAIAISDAKVEPHPLWEYRAKPLTKTFELLTLDEATFASDADSLSVSGKQDFTSEGSCNGVAIWVDYQTDDVVITTGEKERILCEGDEVIVWDMFTRQGVYFLQPYKDTKTEVLSYKISLDVETGSVDFTFL